MSVREPVDWPCETPWQDIAAAFVRECPNGFYPMSMVDELDIIQAVYDQGIDSRLEAITSPSTNEWASNAPLGKRLNLRLDLSSFLVFLRRLHEFEGDMEDGGPVDRAETLYRDLLGTLGIELV